MPFCPKCRVEYRPGFTECSDCHEALVAELPEVDRSLETGPSYTQDWVPVAQFGTQAYADMIEGGFKSLGIPVTVLSGTGHFGQTGQMGTDFQPSGGAYIVLVPETEVERAHEEGRAMLGELWDASRPRTDG